MSPNQIIIIIIITLHFLGPFRILNKPFFSCTKAATSSFHHQISSCLEIPFIMNLTNSVNFCQLIPTHYEIQQIIIMSWADERVEDEGFITASSSIIWTLYTCTLFTFFMLLCSLLCDVSLAVQLKELLTKFIKILNIAMHVVMILVCFLFWFQINILQFKLY